MWPAISVPLISFIVATLAVGWLARTRLAIDEPNSRSLHTIPVPRTGGIGLLLGIAAGFVVAKVEWPPTVWFAAATVILISMIDDMRGLSAGLRFAAHLFAAALTAAALLGTESPMLLLVGAIFAIAWMCNLYNFMDGSDGLAGGMAVSGFLAYAAAAWFAGSTQFALLNLGIAGAAAGFLVHNFHPARIFLGDAGSVPLGFLAATAGLIGWQQQDWPLWFPPLVFSPFIVDATITLTKRLLTGARIWEAHRDHYYQRLVQIGLGHRGTALAEYAAMTACAVAGLAAIRMNATAQYVMLGLTGLFYVAVIVTIEYKWQARLNGHA